MDETTNSQQLHQEEPGLSGQPPWGPPAQKRGIKWIFVGKSGIRAGWGILLFIIVLFLVGFGLFALLHHFAPRLMERPGMMMTPATGAVSEGIQVLMVLIATWVMSLIERKSVLAYGYQGRARGPRFVAGLVWGFIAISALVLTLWSRDLLVFDGRVLHGGQIWLKAAEWAGVFLLVAVFEESTLRGYLQYTMTRGVGFWWGALLFSFLFGFAHTTNPGESPVGLVSAGLVGLVFCLSIWYTGSLWWAVGFHAAWDWGQSYFYGTLDSGVAVKGHLFSVHSAGTLLWSGGKTGPEGSIFVLPELALIALFMWLWWGRKERSPFAGSGWRPAWSRKPQIVDAQTTEKAA